MPIQAMIESSQRGPFDNLSTPKEALDYLLPWIPNGLIWECAPGAGNLVKLLIQANIPVIHLDKDFFKWEPPDYKAIITNPPFSKKKEFLERCMRLNKPWALLLPVTTLGVKKCQPFLKHTEILFLPKRIDFTGKKAPWFAVAWFTYGFNMPNQLNFCNTL